MPDPSKQGVKKLHPTDATQNLGLFLPNEEPHKLAIVDYKDMHGHLGTSLGFGVRTDVARKAGDLLGIIVFGTFITEEKFVENALANGEPTDFPRSPGAFALQKPYEKVGCIAADNCPARYINDAKGVPGAVNNCKIVQHPDPRKLCFDAMLGLHLILQAECTADMKAGDQLFMDYGVNYWDSGAPINRKDIDETELGDIGVEVDSEDEVLEVGKQRSSQEAESFATPRATKKQKNATAVSPKLSTPLTPLSSLDDGVDLINNFYPEQKSSNSKASSKKTPTKSGGGKEIDLDALPQTTNNPKRSKRATSETVTDTYDSPSSDRDWNPRGSNKKEKPKKNKKDKKKAKKSEKAESSSKKKDKKSKKAEKTPSASPKTSTKKGKPNWEEAKGGDEKEKLRELEAESATATKATPKKTGYTFG